MLMFLLFVVLTILVGFLINYVFARYIHICTVCRENELQETLKATCADLTAESMDDFFDE
jgi:hypothetical protein